MIDTFSPVEPGTSPVIEEEFVLADTIQVQPSTVEVTVERGAAVLAPGETITEATAAEVFSRYGSQIQLATDSTVDYLEALFKDQGVEEPNIHATVVGPNDLVNWNQGVSYIRSTIDKAVPLAHVTYQTDDTKGGITVWLEWDTGQVYTDLDG